MVTLFAHVCRCWFEGLRNGSFKTFYCPQYTHLPADHPGRQAAVNENDPRGEARTGQEARPPPRTHAHLREGLVEPPDPAAALGKDVLQGI